jgi:hypothetical protein
MSRLINSFIHNLDEIRDCIDHIYEYANLQTMKEGQADFMNKRPRV